MGFFGSLGFAVRSGTPGSTRRTLRRTGIPPQARAVELLEDRALLATFLVTSAADGGTGTLRQAIHNANASAGADVIQFAVGSGVQTIDLLSELPTLADNAGVTIDGTTQPGTSAGPRIELNDASASGANGFRIQSSNNVIRGLTINRFGSNGVLLDVGASNNLVEKNSIGTDATGTQDRGNAAAGVLVWGGASNNVISGNVISGIHGNGVYVETSWWWAVPTTGNVIRGNTIGLTADGRRQEHDWRNIGRRRQRHRLQLRRRRLRRGR